MQTAARRAHPRILTAISLLARLGLAAVWLISGWMKLRNPLDTTAAIYAYEVVPGSWVPAVAMILPVAELIMGILLVLGIAVRLSGLLSALLLGTFIVLIISAWARGLTIDCGCFGGGGYDPTAGPRLYLQEILRDSGFIFLALWLVVFPRTPAALLRSERA